MLKSGLVHSGRFGIAILGPEPACPDIEPAPIEVLKTHQGRRASFVIMAFVTMGVAYARGGKEAPAREDIPATLIEARNAADDAARGLFYQQIQGAIPKEPKDVRALYDELHRIESEHPDENRAKRLIKLSKPVSDALARSTDASSHQVIADILVLEEEAISAGDWGPWGATSKQEALQAELRMGRLQALTRAAGAGKNERALPALRKMRRKGGVTGKLAETAIGEIGKSEDLDAFIAGIKNDPTSRVSLSGFWAAAVDRIMHEIEAPTLSREQKRRLIGCLPNFVSYREMPRYQALLSHRDADVVKVAARIVGNSVTGDDVQVIRDMLASGNHHVKGSAMVALQRVWNIRMLPDVLKVLRDNPDSGNRSVAAHILGGHNVQEAKTALQEAAQKDPVPSVRESAATALRFLERK